jgi:hypothetical protein
MGEIGRNVSDFPSQSSGDHQPPGPVTDPGSGLRWFVTLALVTFVLGLVVLSIVASDHDGDVPDGDDVASRESPSTTTDTPADETTVPTTTSTSAPATTTTTEPQPGFGGGTFVVGDDIQSGRYMASDVNGCYWERVSGLGGTVDEVIVNAYISGQAIVEILPTDAGFNSDHCGRWVPYTPPAQSATSFGDGDWVVGEQIPPGRYRSDGSGECYWERASGFSHNFDEIIANDFVESGPVVVEVAAGERFTVATCGTWTPG